MCVSSMFMCLCVSSRVCVSFWFCMVVSAPTMYVKTPPPGIELGSSARQAEILTTILQRTYSGWRPCTFCRSRSYNRPCGACNASSSWSAAYQMDTLGIEPRAFRMRSGCDTTTPCARQPATPVPQPRNNGQRYERHMCTENSE